MSDRPQDKAKFLEEELERERATQEEARKCFAGIVESMNKSLSERDEFLGEIRYYLDQMVDGEGKLVPGSDKRYRTKLIEVIDRLRAGGKG